MFLIDRIIWGSYPSNQEPTGVNEIIYNTTDSKMKIYDGSNWVDFGGGSGGSSVTQNHLLMIFGVKDLEWVHHVVRQIELVFLTQVAQQLL